MKRETLKIISIAVIIFLLIIPTVACVGSVDNSTINAETTKPDKISYTETSYDKTSVSLSWGKVNCDGYKIYQKSDNGKWVDVGTTNNNETSYTIKDLKEGSYYTFKVCAYNCNGNKNLYGKSKTITVATESSNYGKNLAMHMDTYKKVCQLFIVRPEKLTGVQVQTSASTDTKQAIEKYPVGGIISFAQNLITKKQTQEMLKNFQQYSQEACNIGMFTAVDEEGGLVARCASKLNTKNFKSMSYYEHSSKKTLHNIGKSIGKDISSIGFNVDFAPVADVNINPKNELGERIFSSNPYTVANLTTAFVKGMQKTGVSATLKHFPGLGAASGNTHVDGFVYLNRTLKQLENTEFIAFKKAIKNNVDFVMVGHQIPKATGNNLPADLSKKVVTGWLRKKLGFKGIIITDSQEMNSIVKNYGSGKSAVKSILAGVDIILQPSNVPNAIKTVYKKVKDKTISIERLDKSVARILNLKHKKGLC